ncbi:MAG: hypothetical protein ACXACI_15050 [Candidatus Hodarchaeales archaeon]|jgi:hypothetical protein
MPELLSIETVNLGFFILHALISLGILGMMIHYHRKHPYTTYIFLIFATLFYLLEEIVSQLFIPQGESSEAFLEIIVPMALATIAFTGAAFFLVLFFQSFESSRVLTQTNLYLMLLFTILTSGLLITTLQLSAALPEFEGLTDEEIFESEDSDIVTLTLFFFVVFLMGSFGFSLAMVARVFIKLRRRIKATTNPLVKNKLKQMRYALVGMVLGSLASETIRDLTELELGGVLSVLAFGYFVYLYSSSGTFILPAESLQKFIIIGTEGMPLFSYNFQPDESESIPFDHQDVLFSGALRAISTLFSEFTGKLDQALKEVTLENVVVMANQIADRRFLAVLLVEQSTRFFREAFDNATEQLDHFISQNQNKLHPNKTLTIPQIQAMDQVIESNFGGGLQRNYEAQA